MPRLPIRPVARLTIAVVAGIAWTGCAGPGPAALAAELERCAPVERTLVDAMGMIAEAGADTIQDPRTGRTLPGCRVTAALSTTLAMGEQSEAMYEGLRAAGWRRTPDPRDAPGEGSLRLRIDGADCLFSPYYAIMIGTEAEIRVINRLGRRPGAERFSVLVRCVEALEAAPRTP